MACSLFYLDSAPISETEKERLLSVHLEILEEAKKSGAFRRENNQYVTIKNLYDKATEFILAINNKYAPKVAMLPSIGNGKHALNINTLPLTTEIQLPLLQTEDIQTFHADEKTLDKIKEAAKKMGISITDLASYARSTGMATTSVNGIADLVLGTVAIAEGKEGVALTEETVHIATAIMEQTNPKLVTEMISKINRFKIYDLTLKAYRDNKNYQLPDGKPNIRKIKKEAVDKLISEVIINKGADTEQFPELREESNMTIVQQMWNAVLDFIKGIYRKADISIFEEAASEILNEDIGTVEDIQTEGVFLSIEPNQKVDELYNKFVDIDKRMELIPQLKDKKRHYLFDNQEVEKTVTEKIKANQPAFERTPEQAEQDDQKRSWGSEGHEYIANYISTNLVDESGYALQTPKKEAISSNLDKRVEAKLQNFAQKLIKRYKPGTRFIIEKKVINEKVKGKLASTVDFVAIEPIGDSYKVDIFDWKFTNIDTEKESDVPWYKQKEWNAQMKEYTQIAYNYGVKPEQLRNAWMVPFLANYKYANKNDKTLLTLNSIEIGDLDSRAKTELYLLPVPLVTESSGEPVIDKLANSLLEYHKKLYDTIVSSEDKFTKGEKLKSLSKAIRSLRLKKDYEPLITVGRTFLNNAAESFKKIEGANFDTISKQEIDSLAKELLSIRESAYKFASLDQSFLAVFPKENFTEDDKKIFKSIEDISSSTNRMLVKIQGDIDNPGLLQKLAMQVAIKGGYETEETAEDILAPEHIINFLGKTLLEASKLPSRIVKIASNIIQTTKNTVAIKASEMVNNTFSPLLLELEKDAQSRGKKAFDLIGKVNNGRLQLFRKIDPEFGKEIFKAKQDKDKKFYLKNMDLAKYNKLAKEAIKRREEEKKKQHFSDDPKQDEIKRNRAIKEIKKALDIESKEFNGYNDFDFKRLFWESFKEEDHLSKEYKDMPESARKMWQFLSNLNTRAYESGYITGRQKRDFFPLMEATIVEKLYNSDSLLSESKEILKDLYTVRVEDETSYSKTDETGKIKRSIPKLFTRTNKEAHQLSTDLNKVGVIWIKSLLEYENSRDIENTLLLLGAVEKAKGNLIKGPQQETIFEGGTPKVLDEENKNYPILETIVNDAIYGITENLNSIGNIGATTALNKINEGKTEEEKEQRVINAKKALNNANKWVQGLAVGWKLLVTIPNYFGFNMQAGINAGRFGTGGEFQKNHLKVLTGKVGGLSLIEKALLDKLIPFNDNVSTELRRQIASKEGFLEYLNTWTFYDAMMATNSFPDKLLQMANALTFFENTIVIDGKLINIRQYLDSKDRKDKYTMSQEERRTLEQSYNSRVKELKENNLLKIAKIEGTDIIIPGVSQEELGKFRTKIIEYSRNLSGQMSENNKADFRRDTILKSFMMFKGWIPKQVSLRTLDINYNYELEQWEYGRTRAFFKTLAHLGLRNITQIGDIISGNEEGLKRLKELYDLKKEAYFAKTGQELQITEEEFYDMMRHEIRNQAKELATVMLLGLLYIGIRIAEPPEDEEDGYKNRYKLIAKALNKGIDELWFYYNPLSMESMTRGSILPALGILTKSKRALEELGKEAWGESFDNQEYIDEAHPLKYIFNLTPGFSQFQNELLPIIDPEMAKEMGIKTTAEARALR